MKRILAVLTILTALALLTGCALQGGGAGGVPGEVPGTTDEAAPTEELLTPQERWQQQMAAIFGQQTVTTYDADKAALTVTVTEGYEDAAVFLHKCVQACSALLTAGDADTVLETATILFGNHTLMAGKSKTVPSTVWYSKAFSRDDAQYDALEQAYYANATLAGQDIGV